MIRVLLANIKAKRFCYLKNFKLDKVSSLLVAANYVVGLTGAGVSVESGISPYRGPRAS